MISYCPLLCTNSQPYLSSCHCTLLLPMHAPDHFNVQAAATQPVLMVAAAASGSADLPPGIGTFFGPAIPCGSSASSTSSYDSSGTGQGSAPRRLRCEPSVASRPHKPAASAVDTAIDKLVQCKAGQRVQPVQSEPGINEADQQAGLALLQQVGRNCAN